MRNRIVKRKKQRNILTKDGLTGNSGDISESIHISAPYAATKNKVFVENGDGSWERMTINRAVKEKKKIITCGVYDEITKTCCTRPAVSIDHYYPYYTNYNYCIKHRKLIIQEHNKV